MRFPDELPATESPQQHLIRRRGALGTLGLAGFGWLAASLPVSALTSRKSATPRVSVPTSSGNAVRQPAMRFSTLPDLPDEWRARHGALATDYFRYLGSLKLKRVSPAQVLASHAKEKGSVWNTLPPKPWWNRMGYVLKVVDRIAMEMNVHEVEVISAYRSPAYNSRCAGARTGSWHQANVAVDVKFPVRASQVTRTARELRDLGLFRGGVGGYWNFTHIDARGTNVNW